MFKKLITVVLGAFVIIGCGEETDEQIIAKVFKVDETTCKEMFVFNPFSGGLALVGNYKKDLPEKHLKFMEELENNPSQFVYERTIFTDRCIALVSKEPEDLEKIKAHALKEKADFEKQELDYAVRTGKGRPEVLEKAEKVKQEQAKSEAERKAKEAKAKIWEQEDNEELKNLYRTTKALSIEGIVLPYVNERSCKNTNDKWLLDNEFSQEKAAIFKSRCAELGYEIAK